MACELTDFLVMLQLWLLIHVTIQGSLLYAWPFVGKIKRNNKLTISFYTETLI